MPETANKSEIDELKSELQQLADLVAAKCSNVGDAIVDLLAAVDYEDEALVDSTIVSLLAALANLTNKCIAKEVDTSKSVQAGLMNGWQKHIDKKAYEIAVFEVIKDTIESIIDERIASMLSLRKCVHLLNSHQQDVENAQALEDGIRGLRRFRDDFLKGGPSRKPPAPIDHQAIAKARSEIAAGRKGMSKDQLVWGKTKVSE